MTTIDDALAKEPNAVAAWHHKAKTSWLGVFRVGASGAALLAHTEMATAERPATEEKLRGLGVTTGATDGEFVWVLGDRGFSLWNANRAVTESGADELLLSGQSVRRDEVAAVVSFVDRSDLGHRGVFVLVKERGAVLVVDEHDPAAEADPTYNINNVLFDGAWALRLASDLAAWLGVPTRRESSPP